MKKSVFICLVFFAVFSAFADETSDNIALLRKIDSLTSFSGQDLSAEYQIETRSPEGGISKTTATMFRRDSKNQFLILILKPEVDKGKGYLKNDDILWLYEPKTGAFTFTSAKDRFQKSGLRNSDFETSHYSRDYKIVDKTTETLGKFNCQVISLEATTSNVSFPKIKMWVSEDFLVRKVEDYSLSGQLMRTTAIPSYQKVDKKWIPATLTILDHLMARKVGDKTMYEKTTIKIDRPSLKSIPDSTYTKDYLQRIR